MNSKSNKYHMSSSARKPPGDIEEDSMCSSFGSVDIQHRSAYHPIKTLTSAKTKTKE